LKNKKFYIFNQPYPVEEYEKKIEEIKNYFIKNSISDVYSLVKLS